MFEILIIVGVALGALIIVLDAADVGEGSRYQYRPVGRRGRSRRGRR